MINRYIRLLQRMFKFDNGIFFTVKFLNSSVCDSLTILKRSSVIELKNLHNNLSKISRKPNTLVIATCCKNYNRHHDHHVQIMVFP